MTEVAEKAKSQVTVEGTRDKKCLKACENWKVINDLMLGQGIQSQEGIRQKGQSSVRNSRGRRKFRHRVHSLGTLLSCQLWSAKKPLLSGPFPLSRPRNKRKGSRGQDSWHHSGADPPSELIKLVKQSPLRYIFSGQELITWVLKWEGMLKSGGPSQITRRSLCARS